MLIFPLQKLVFLLMSLFSLLTFLQKIQPVGFGHLAMEHGAMSKAQ